MTNTKSILETNSPELPAALQQRLNLAENLVRSGDIKRALEFAEPGLGHVTMSTLDFLTLLRDKDPVAAHLRYIIMLRQTSSNPLADANTVSLLASYIFTPRMYVTFNREGGADASWMRTTFPPANVSPQLRLTFFQVAHSVLLRPLSPPDQDQTTTGVPGKFMVVRRLMPLFEQYAPTQLADALRGQLEALNALVSDSVRASEKEWAERGIAPGLLSLSVNNKKQVLGRKFDHIPDFEIKGIFSEIASKDFDRAIQVAHGFEREAPRANATIIICRSLLNDKLTTSIVK